MIHHLYFLRSAPPPATSRRCKSSLTEPRSWQGSPSRSCSIVLASLWNRRDGGHGQRDGSHGRDGSQPDRCEPDLPASWAETSHEGHREAESGDGAVKAEHTNEHKSEHSGLTGLSEDRQ